MRSRARRNWAHFMPWAPELRDTGINCLGAGEQRGMLRPVNRRTLPCHGLVFVAEGAGEYADALGTHTTIAPSIIWLFPGVEHNYGPRTPGWAEHWILFEGIGARGYESYGAWDRTRPVIELTQPISAEIHSCFGELETASSSPGLTHQIVAATLVHRLIGLASVQAGLDQRDSRNQSVVKLITETAADPFSVNERASQLGVSPERLRRQIREVTGLTPHELVLQARLSKAQRLLIETSLGVSEIARLVGYDDPAYFSRLFAKRLGLPPSQFRIQQTRLP